MQPRRTSTLRWILIFVMVTTLALSLRPPHVMVEAYQTTNLLQNPGFEQPFVAIDGNSAVRVATGWQPWSVSGGSSTAVNARPEYQPASANRVQVGLGRPGKYNTFFATHIGGVYQRVPVAAGTSLQFSIYMYVWSSAPFDNPNVSEDPNDVKVRIGIDPTGGTDGTSSSIVWSTEQEFYDSYQQLSVTATAKSSAVTVFVRSAPQGFVGTTNIYLDDALLVPLAVAPPTATPVGPTATPDNLVPTQEGTLTAVPTSGVSTQPPVPTAVPTLPSTLAPVSSPTPQVFYTATPVLPGGFNDTVIYRVVSGDTVSQIASRYGSTIDAIVDANDLSNAALIYVGQTLVIPVKTTTYTRPPTFTPSLQHGADDSAECAGYSHPDELVWHVYRPIGRYAFRNCGTL